MYKKKPIRFVDPYEPPEDVEVNKEQEYEEYMKHQGDLADAMRDEEVEQDAKD